MQKMMTTIHKEYSALWTYCLHIQHCRVRLSSIPLEQQDEILSNQMRGGRAEETETLQWLPGLGLHCDVTCPADAQANEWSVSTASCFCLGTLNHHILCISIVTASTPVLFEYGDLAYFPLSELVTKGGSCEDMELFQHARQRTRKHSLL